MLLKYPIIILCIGMIISGCSSWIQKEKSQIVHTLGYNNIEDNISITGCVGKGQISSTNPLKGKLYFSFSSTRDSLQIQIKDFLGRRLYSIQGNTQEIFIINHQNDTKHDLDNLIQYYSISDVVTPDILQNYLWGEIAISDIKSKDVSGLKVENGSIFFSANKSPEDRLIDTVKIDLDEPKIDLTIVIIEREFYEDSHLYKTDMNN
ncbi:MAG: hypothetical protein VX767_00090 [Candidatus Neomarinimicrobiota bacterium]|nr:hypothetical protein [Candidatus Neomarinimicrobiota bacterium]